MKYKELVKKQKIEKLIEVDKLEEWDVMGYLNTNNFYFSFGQ